MTAGTISLLTFVTVTLCVLGAAGVIGDLFLKERGRVNERFRQALRDDLRARAQSSPLFKDLRTLPAGEMLPTESLFHKVQTWIDQSGYAIQLYQLALLSTAAGLLAWVVVAAVMGSLLLATCVAFAAAVTPWACLHVARNRRRARLCEQLPEVFEVMSRAIRVGQTVQAAFQVIGNDFPGPVAQEFAYCYEQQHLGISQEAALRDLARRMPIMELRIFAVALIINVAPQNLADRTGLEEMRSLTTFVQHALKFGSTMSDALRQMSDMLRTQREQRVEERAHRAAVLILLPTLLFIFPTVFVVLVGPAVIQIQRALLK